MEKVIFRVDRETAEALREEADIEGESLAVLLRRVVRRHVRGHNLDVRQAVAAHEGSGRVR